MYKVFDKFLVRTPLFPFNNDKLINDIDYNDDLFKEAIYIASNELYNEMSKKSKVEKKEKIDATLYKYWRRIQTRTTPYGLFSGVTIGNIEATDTKVVLDKTFVKHTRLDMNILCSIISFLEKNEEIRNKILFHENDTIYPVYNQLRYYEKNYQNNIYFKYSISSVDYSVYLNQVLNYVKKDGRSIEELISFVQDILEDVTYEDAEAFIIELIDSNVLVSELQPCIIGEDILTNIINILKNRGVKHDLIKYLIKINSLLEDIKYSQNDGINSYQEIVSLLDKLGIPYDKKNIFQIDLYKNATYSTLDNTIPKDLLNAILFITKLNGSNKKEDNLELFKKMFMEKYEDRELDLLFATDADVGIGYPPSYVGSPYSNDLINNLRYPEAKQNTSQIEWNDTQSILLRKIMEANKRSDIEIILNDEDITNDEVKQMYPTFFCGFEIISKENGNNLLKINSVGGNSAAHLITRFSHTNPQIEAFVKEIGQKEQEMEQIPILEINHLPNPRFGNVLIRPQMRKFELTIASNSKLEKEKIPVSDLKISVKNGNIILKSKKLNCNVKTAHTNAFNNKLSTIPAFNFLCDLQDDNNYLSSLSLIPNFKIDFIPRIKYKNVILYSATWIFTQKEMKKYIGKGSTQEIKAWRDENKIPQYILFAQGDNELFINLDNEKGINSLMDIIQKNTTIILKEFLYDEKSVTVEDLNGEQYRNEFVIAYYKN